VKALATRFWNEPAVAIGLLATVLLAVLNWLGDNTWSADDLIAIVAPLLSGLGIRPLVTPTHAGTEEVVAERVNTRV
jgi:hypothetical protein